jgi:hypothetical protein
MDNHTDKSRKIADNYQENSNDSQSAIKKTKFK